MHGAPMYIAETAPASVRGLLISLKEGFIVGGILLGYLVGFLLIDEVSIPNYNPLFEYETVYISLGSNPKP